MKMLKFSEVSRYVRREAFCMQLIPPLNFSQKSFYSAGIECDYHENSEPFAALILEGEMIYQERGCEPLLCCRGTIVLLPANCSYRWEIRRAVVAFQCRHTGFSLHEYGALATLFGIWQQTIEAIALPPEFIDDFVQKLEAVPERKFAGLQYSNLWLELFIETLETCGGRDQTARINSPLRQCIYYIEEHLNRGVSLNELARCSHVSTSRLFQLFHTAFNMPPLAYIAERKAARARQLLETTAMTCEEIAGMLGFSSANYFIRFFKKHTGVTPGEIRRHS